MSRIGKTVVKTGLADARCVSMSGTSAVLCGKGGSSAHARSVASAWLALVRLPVSFMVAVASGFGYLLVHPGVGANFGLTVAGTFLLAGACSALNQVQERRTDALFRRTANRPLPSGNMHVSTALCVTVGLVCGAMRLFALLGNPLLLWLAGGVIGVYNGIYTPLKRQTGFALPIGALPGAMPPVLGWVAAGGQMTDVGCVTLFVVYYLWQIPHFWLRVERDRDEYARAGLPIPVICFSERRYARLLGIWFSAYVAALLTLPLFPLLHTPTLRVIAVVGAMALMCGPGYMLYRGKRSGPVERWVNLSLPIAMLLLLADAMWQTV